MSKSDVVNVLENVRLKNIPLIVQHPLLNKMNDQQYYVLVHNITKTENAVKLIEMVPCPFETTFLNNLVVNFTSVASEGKSIFFNERIEEVQKENGNSVYTIALPDKVEFIDRRAATRFDLKERNITVIIEVGNANYSAKLHDISVLGLQLNFEHNIADQFQSGEKVFINFSPSSKKTSEKIPLEVRWIQYEEKADITRVGGCFIEQDKTMQLLLGAFIAMLEN